VTESLDKLAKAGTVSEMIQAAQEVVGSPTMPAGFDATRENLAMTAMERQMADDASAMRFSGGRESAQPAPTTRRAPQAQASATIVPDAPMLDRLATVQESLRDARVRDQVRQQFGEDGLKICLGAEMRFTLSWVKPLDSKELCVNISEIKDLLLEDNYPLTAKTKSGDVVDVAKVLQKAINEGRAIWTKRHIVIVGNTELTLFPER
jgi:hypothetical protein